MVVIVVLLCFGTMWFDWIWVIVSLWGEQCTDRVHVDLPRRRRTNAAVLCARKLMPCLLELRWELIRRVETVLDPHNPIRIAIHLLHKQAVPFLQGALLMFPLGRTYAEPNSQG